MIWMEVSDGAQRRGGMSLFHGIPIPAEALWTTSRLLLPLIAFVATHCGECEFAINHLPTIK
jgi:hypothetical protein